jgi:hypothetical protein
LKAEHEVAEHDEQRSCTDCGASFWFRAGEQRFFASRGLPDLPRRCEACRRRRKEVARSGPASNAPKPAAREPRLPRCAWCGGFARVPASVHADVAGHRPVACEACYRWRLGFGSGLVEPGVETGS